MDRKLYPCWYYYMKFSYKIIQTVTKVNIILLMMLMIFSCLILIIIKPSLHSSINVHKRLCFETAILTRCVVDIVIHY